MSLKEKYKWAKLYAVEFGILFIFQSLVALRWDISLQGVAAGGLTGMGLITLVLLFRITYLKGKGSRND